MVLIVGARCYCYLCLCVHEIMADLALERRLNKSRLRVGIVSYGDDARDGVLFIPVCNSNRNGRMGR
ncbi:hypothetical protein L2E82_06161 [Cichorium intybus]|uniref:Uncharacterized protein n=1 Tax=Cichorium intybus TaxID=13427 RepID=A0ACB9HAD3_CICIN|nr:hypothetical protein L2E82_06161 [Cichorium intybus]